MSIIFVKSISKLIALALLEPFMKVDKRRIIITVFIESQFGYCPFAWMFHIRNNTDLLKDFQDFLDKDISLTIHHRNTGNLANET